MYQTVSAWSDVTRMIIFFILVSLCLFLTIAYYIILIQGKFFIAMQSIFFTLRTWTVWNDEMMRQCSWTRSSATSLARVNIFICSIIPSLRRRVIGISVRIWVESSWPSSSTRGSTTATFTLTPWLTGCLVLSSSSGRSTTTSSCSVGNPLLARSTCHL